MAGPNSWNVLLIDLIFFFFWSGYTLTVKGDKALLGLFWHFVKDDIVADIRPEAHSPERDIPLFLLLLAERTRSG